MCNKRYSSKAKKVTEEFIQKILDTEKTSGWLRETEYGEPHGMFWYYDKAKKVYVGCDNSDGYAWMEEFKRKSDLFRWFNGESIDEILERRK